MRVSDVNPMHVFALLFCFWVMWLYTEISEYHSRSVFNDEVNRFMTRGDRFTAQDGEKLRRRIEALEESRIERLEDK